MLDGRVRLRVTYYCDTIVGDVDNLVKAHPGCVARYDALQGIAYRDDRQVSEVTGRRWKIDGLFRIRYTSPALAMAFSDGRPFVHIEVWANPRQEVVG
jgi:hypothetical protein